MATSINMQEIPRFTYWEIYNSAFKQLEHRFFFLIRTAKWILTRFSDRGVTSKKVFFHLQQSLSDQRINDKII